MDREDVRAEAAEDLPPSKITDHAFHYHGGEHPGVCCVCRGYDPDHERFETADEAGCNA